eukprot:5221900-Prymnesium_polylepis.3
MAHIAINPRTYKTCGFDYTGTAHYQSYGCAKRGFQVATPFAIGAFVALSPSLVHFVASDGAVAAFVARYARRDDNATVLLEDMALGFWLAHSQHNVTCQCSGTIRMHVASGSVHPQPARVRGRRNVACAVCPPLLDGVSRTRCRRC